MQSSVPLTVTHVQLLEHVIHARQITERRETAATLIAPMSIALVQLLQHVLVAKPDTHIILLQVEVVH